MSLSETILCPKGFQNPFFFINIVAFIIFPFGGYYIIYASNWGIAGFGIFKFTIEFANCIGLIIAQKIYGHPESLKREPLKEILAWKDVKDYISVFGKILGGWYAGYFGLEINTVFIGISGGDINMNCWVSYLNMFSITWTIGAGLAITTRTMCGTLLGQNKPMLARKYAFMGFVLAFVYSVLMATLIICIRGSLASMFTQVPEVWEPVKYQMLLAGVLVIFSGTGPIGSTIFRVIDRSGLYSMITIMNMTIISTGISAVCMFVFNLGANASGYAFLIAFFNIFCMTVAYFSTFDWNKLYKKA